MFLASFLHVPGLTAALAEKRGYCFGRIKRIKGVSYFELADSVRINKHSMNGFLCVLHDLLEIVRQGSEHKKKARLTGVATNTNEHILEPARGGYRRVVRIELDDANVPLIAMMDQYNPQLDVDNDREGKRNYWFDRSNSPFNIQVRYIINIFYKTTF